MAVNTKASARIMQRLADQKKAAEALGDSELADILAGMLPDANDLLEQSIFDDAFEDYGAALKKRGTVYSMLRLAEYAVAKSAAGVAE